MYWAAYFRNISSMKINLCSLCDTCIITCVHNNIIIVHFPLLVLYIVSDISIIIALMYTSIGCSFVRAESVSCASHHTLAGGSSARSTSDRRDQRKLQPS